MGCSGRENGRGERNRGGGERDRRWIVNVKKLLLPTPLPLFTSLFTIYYCIQHFSALMYATFEDDKRFVKATPETPWQILCSEYYWGDTKLISR